jgi:hypothetical protein
MTDQGKTFKYKLDFYYQSALIYTGTLIVYGVVRGSFVEKRLEFVLDDPVVYLIVFFVLMSVVTLLLNLLRNRRLIVTHDALIFKHRWQERRINLSEIEWMHIGREPRVQTGGRFQVIVFKLKERRRLLRIRVGRYERERELVAEMNRFAALVPRRKPRPWQTGKITDR